MSSLSSSLGTIKPKTCKVLMAPRPLRNSTSAHQTTTSSPMIGIDPCTELLEEDLLTELNVDFSSNEDSAETELQMIFGGALASSSSVSYYDSEYYPQSSLYYSDECVMTNFGLLSLDNERNLNPRFDSFPELGASPAPEVKPSSPFQGIPSRAKNPLAQEVLKKKQMERVQEKIQVKQDSKNAGYGASPSAVHHLIASLSVVSPPPRHRSYSEPIPFGAASRTEVGSCG